MGNNHSEQEPQSKGNPESKQESLSKQKKDTDIWSSFRNKTKASTVSQPSPFKPVPPNIFKGIPDFSSTSATSTFSIHSKQFRAEPPPKEIPLNSTPAIPAFVPQTSVQRPNQLWVPKEPSAYNISWERPQIKSPLPSPISSFIFPSITENNPPKETLKPVSQTIPVKSPTESAGPSANSSSCQRTPPQIPKEAWSEPPAPAKPLLPPKQAQEPVIKEAVASTSLDAPVPFLFTGTTPEKTQGPSASEVTVVEPPLEEKSEKTSSNSDNTVVHNSDGKNDNKINRQIPAVISEQTHAEIMSRLAYVEIQKSLPEPAVNQSQAVVRRALNGVSYAEAVKKSQPKINPARREAKAKLLKKLKISKSVAKETEKLKDVESAEEGSIVLQQLSDKSSHQPPPKSASDQAITPKKNVKAVTEHTTNLNQNELSAISPSPTQRENDVLLTSATKKTEQNTTYASSKSTKPEYNNPNQTKNLATFTGVRGTDPSLNRIASKTPFCQEHNFHSFPVIDLKNKTLEEIVSAVKASPYQFTQSQHRCGQKAAGASNVFPEKPQQSKQKSSEAAGIERGKVRESTKHVPLEVNAKPGPNEDPALTDTQKYLDNSAANSINSELSNPTATSKETQEPLIAPNRSDQSSGFTDSSVKLSVNCSPLTNTLNARSDEQSIPTVKDTPTSPSKFINKDQKTQTKIPAQFNQVQTKEAKQLPPKSKVAEKENEEKLQDAKLSPSSPQPPPRPKGRWQPFTTDRSCVQKVRCQHRENGKLPKNVMQWLNVSQNYLCEPSWVTTASLAASIALSVRLDREDSHQ